MSIWELFLAADPVVKAVMLLLMFVGGCAGSTAGGIKVSRIVLLFKLSWGQLRRSFRPQVVHIVRMGKEPVDSSVILDVAAFFLIFMVTMAAGVMLITLTEGVSVPTAFGAMLTAVSNMGMMGVRDFAAVVNPPHATILAVGAGEKRPVVKNDALAIATMMTVTLSTDHRAVDGALGAELLAAFKGYIENPMSMLV